VERAALLAGQTRLMLGDLAVAEAEVEAEAV